jgi:hypothetical protein
MEPDDGQAQGEDEAMSEKVTMAADETVEPTPGKQLAPAAQRALAEAAERRARYDQKAAEAVPEPEIDGRKGPEAVRYGDWESKGLTSDF